MRIADDDGGAQDYKVWLITEDIGVPLDVFTFIPNLDAIGGNLGVVGAFGGFAIDQVSFVDFGDLCGLRILVEDESNVPIGNVPVQVFDPFVAGISDVDNLAIDGETFTPDDTFDNVSQTDATTGIAKFINDQQNWPTGQYLIDVNSPIFNNSGNLDVASKAGFGTAFESPFVDCTADKVAGIVTITIELGAVGEKDFVFFVQNGVTGDGIANIPVSLEITDFFDATNVTKLGIITDANGDADFDDVPFGTITVDINNATAVATAGGSVNASFNGEQNFNFVDQFSPSETFASSPIFPV